MEGLPGQLVDDIKVFSSRGDLLEFLKKQPQIEIVKNDEGFGQMTVVRLCSEDAKRCGGVDRWLLVNGEFIHSIIISRDSSSDSSSNKDDFFKMICLCDPDTIRKLEKLCMNPRLEISYLADFFKAGQFLESLDKEAEEEAAAAEAEAAEAESETNSGGDIISMFKGISPSLETFVLHIIWKALLSASLCKRLEDRHSTIKSALKTALDGVRRGCALSRGIVVYILMKHRDFAFDYQLNYQFVKQISELLIKYHLSCIRTPNKYTLFVEGIRMLPTDEPSGIKLIEMAAKCKLEVAECWMGDYFERKEDYAKMQMWYSEELAARAEKYYLPAKMGQLRAAERLR